MTDEKRAPDMDAIRARLEQYTTAMVLQAVTNQRLDTFEEHHIKFSAHAPTDIDALLKRVEELQTALEYYGYDVADDTGEIARAALKGED